MWIRISGLALELWTWTLLFSFSMLGFLDSKTFKKSVDIHVAQGTIWTVALDPWQMICWESGSTARDYKVLSSFSGFMTDALTLDSLKWEYSRWWTARRPSRKPCTSCIKTCMMRQEKWMLSLFWKKKTDFSGVSFFFFCVWNFFKSSRETLQPIWWFL